MNAAPRADILGRLLVIQDAVQGMPSDASTATFLDQALGEVPGVGKVCICLRGALYPHNPLLADACSRFAAARNAPESIGPKDLNGIPRTEIIPIATSRHLYGFLAFGLDDAEAFAPYAGFIKNIAGVVAVYLEAHDNYAEVATARSELEGRVADRTSELSEKNALLEAEITRREKIEQALQETGREVEDLYNNAPCGYQSANKDGFFVSVNDTELRWLGYRREELVGKKRVHDLWSPATRSAFEKAFTLLITQNKSIDEELEMVRKDGTVFPVLLAATALRDSGGNFVRTRGLVHDLTERKRSETELCQSEARLRESEALYRWVVMAMAEGLVFQSANGTILATNPAAERILGEPSKQLLGQLSETLPWECIHEDGTPFVPDSQPAMVSLRTGKPLQDVVMGLRKPNKAPTWISISSQPLRSEGKPVPYAVVSTFRDITEHRQIEQERQLAHLKLQESERTLQLALRAGKIGAFDVDLDSGRSTYTPKIAELWELPPGFSGNFVSYCWDHVHPEDLPETKEAFARLAQSQQEGAMEFRIVRPDGEVRWVLWQGVVVQNSSGAPKRAVGVNMDITERKQAERALVQLNRTLRTLSAANQALVHTTTEEELLNEMCRVGVELGGYRLAWIGFVEHDEAKTLRPVAWDGEHPEYLQTLNVTWADTERGRGPTGTAIRTCQIQVNQNVETNPAMAPWRAELRKYGLKASISLPLKYNSGVFGALTFYSGEPDAFNPDEVELLKELADDLSFGIHARRDRAGREQAEQERLLAYHKLEENEEKFSKAFYSSPNLMAITTPAEGRIMDINNAYCKVLGRTREECIGRTVGELNIWADPRQRDKVVRQIKEKGHALDVEADLRKPSGEISIVNLSMEPITIDRKEYFLSVATDITERKWAEKEKEQYLKFFKLSIDPMCIADPFGNFRQVNPAFIKLTGYTEDELIAKPFLDFVVPEDRDRTAREMELQVKARSSLNFENRYLCKDGTVVLLVWNAFFDKNDGVTYATARDVTERRRVEEQVKSSALYTRSLIEASLDPLVTISPDGKITDVNEATIRTTGGTRASLVGSDFSAYFTEPEKALAGYREVLAKGFVTDYPLTIRHTSGSDVDVLYNASLYRDNKGNVSGVFAAARDVTERKKTERQLKRIEWLLTRKDQPTETAEAYTPPYGDLLKLNTSRLILGSVGEDVLKNIVGSYLNLLDTSSAIYEKDGDYAAGIFSSGWCRFMDAASRAACGTDDNREALKYGQWHCHESCWAHASKVSIETGNSVDIECNGGIRLYAVPIRAGNEIVGSINFGYGDPPRDERTLQELAAKFKVTVEALREQAQAYETRPPYIIEMAKRRLQATSQLLGEIIERKRVEEKLRSAALYTRSLIEASLDPLATVDPDGKITDVNEAAVRATGVSRASLIGSDFSEYFTEPEKARAGFREIYAKGFVSNYPLTIRHVSGSVTDALYNASLYRDEKGNVAGILATARDITERKRIEEQLRLSSLYTRSLIEASLDPLVTISPDGKITDVNEAAIRATGAARASLVGSDFTEYFTEPEKARAGYREVFAKGFVTDYSLTLRHVSGSVTDVLYNASLYLDEKGNVAGVFAAARDVTELMKAEHALLRLNRTLRTLSAANTALVRASSEEELLDETCRIGVEFGGYRLAWIGFAEQDEAKTVRPVAWAGEHPEFVQTANVTWADTERGRGPTGTAIRTGEVQANQNVETNPTMAPWRAEMLKYGLKASIALPLKYNSGVFGTLTFCSGEPDAFGPDEVELLKEMASDLSYGIHARRDRAGRETALAALQENLKSTVQAIATAVEMRDIYTAGHQRHVANLAVAIAHEIGLPEGRIEGLFLAGMIHDVGKINVPTELLSKPGKLTPLEYQMIQTHVQAGYDIVKGVKFPWPLGQMILQHHERLDGSGYPNRLKGDAILIEARILAIADVVDAMLSHRPYRAALGLDAALNEIASGKGRLYEPAIADACITLFRQKGFKFD